MTWSLAQSVILCGFGEESLFWGAARLLDKSSFSSASQAVEALNRGEGVALAPSGFCVTFCSDDQKYALLYRSDSQEEAFSRFQLEHFQVEHKAGVAFRLSPNIQDREASSRGPDYGAIVVGTRDGNWLKVMTKGGARFLPVMVDSYRVLSPVADERAVSQEHAERLRMVEFQIDRLALNVEKLAHETVHSDRGVRGLQRHSDMKSLYPRQAGDPARLWGVAVGDLAETEMALKTEANAANVLCAARSDDAYSGLEGLRSAVLQVGTQALSVVEVPSDVGSNPETLRPVAGLPRVIVAEDRLKSATVELGMLPLFVSMLHHGTLSEQMGASRALWDLTCEQDQGNELAVESGAVRALVDVLERVGLDAAGALGNIATTYAQVVFEAGAVQPLSSLLTRTWLDECSQQHVVRALLNLADYCPESRPCMADAGAVKALLQIAHGSAKENVRVEAMQCLAFLDCTQPGAVDFVGSSSAAQERGESDTCIGNRQKDSTRASVDLKLTVFKLAGLQGSSAGAVDPCVSVEVVGRHHSIVKTPTLANAASPDFIAYSLVIADYIFGEKLKVCVWDHAVRWNDYFLGDVVLSADQVLRWQGLPVDAPLSGSGRGPAGVLTFQVEFLDYGASPGALTGKNTGRLVSSLRGAGACSSPNTFGMGDYRTSSQQFPRCCLNAPTATSSTLHALDERTSKDNFLGEGTCAPNISGTYHDSRWKKCVRVTQIGTSIEVNYCGERLSGEVNGDIVNVKTFHALGCVLENGHIHFSDGVMSRMWIKSPEDDLKVPV